MCDDQSSGSLRVKSGPQVSAASQIQIEEETSHSDIIIVVTQAFCPNGHNLVAPDNPSFDEHPGIHLVIAHGDSTADLFLSPIHGHSGKHSPNPERCPADGARVSVRCPHCAVELPEMGECVSDDGGRLRALYLTPKLVKGYAALVCDVWGCNYSRVVDDWDLLSEVVLRETAEL